MSDTPRFPTKFSYANLLAILLLAAYCVLYWQSLSRYWFSPEWTSDDALQQVYPFYEAIYPGRFAGDIVTESMMSYFAPLHYWIGFGITKLTGDPVMMAHWVTLIQLSLTLLFLFLAVRIAAGFVPGCLAALWFLHSRHLTQRLTGGLSRGWVAPLCAAFLYLLFAKRHLSLCFLILLSCLLNPLAAFMLVLSYGAYFVFEIFAGNFTALKRPIIVFAVCCPVYLFVTLREVKRPEHLGKMVTYEQALNMPELAKKEGRFELLPFAPPEREIVFYSMQIFVATFHKGFKWVKRNAHFVAGAFFICLLVFGRARKRKVVPLELLAFIVAVLAAYFLARTFAFKLYIPVRYIRIPLGMALIVLFCVATWRALSFRENESNAAYRYLPYVGFSMLAVLVWLGSGSGLQKQGNFNFFLQREGNVFAWIREHTPESATIAGYPNFMDPTPLLSIRKVYMSNETAHPFYDKYYELVKHRLEVSLRAHYAKDISELKSVLSNEPIDFFVFERERFYPKEMEKASYFGPFDDLVKSLVTRENDQYAFREIQRDIEAKKAPFVAYEDAQAIVVDVSKLKQG